MAKKKISEKKRLLRNKRQRIYYKKKKILASTDVNTQKQREKLQQKFLKADRELKEVNSKLFKFSKKYNKLKTARKSLSNRIYYLKTKNKDPEATQKDKARNHKEMQELNDRLRDLDKLLGKKIYVEKGEVQFVEDEATGTQSEFLTIWQANEDMRTAMTSGVYLKYIIGDKEFSSDNLSAAIFTLDDYIEDMFAKRHLTKTPMLYLIRDYQVPSIRITDAQM